MNNLIILNIEYLYAIFECVIADRNILSTHYLVTWSKEVIQGHPLVAVI